MVLWYFMIRAEAGGGEGRTLVGRKTGTTDTDTDTDAEDEMTDGEVDGEAKRKRNRELYKPKWRISYAKQPDDV